MNAEGPPFKGKRFSELTDGELALELAYWEDKVATSNWSAEALYTANQFRHTCMREMNRRERIRSSNERTPKTRRRSLGSGEGTDV